jgi:hypothetical protein
MDSVAALALCATFGFEVKHLLCDFVLQTEFQIRDKSFYGHWGGISHAGTHALLTVPVLLVLTESPATIALIAACEFLIHYHIDWAKGYAERVMSWRDKGQLYWIAFGIDQFLHQVTYLAIVVILLVHTAF